ncbi:unnamed protein product [Rotaria socialis]|uniref:Chitin-binding type-2 domain-containing protein n=1 Tax=Rotaria socialis TaxID=392032 RepID=A0A818YGB8_9BILA|nr:unnamed protein product [Rotaria socialis]CAF3312909.1 unnamed protein product [Rotaria socialis]CAF3550951.1 unnamed protein product [Rotaria socialis]CAF3754642.1 unnamed protein product [Rotaria socialis]CAF4086799.1 unnamed protein product [Rotaria socialis]
MRRTIMIQVVLILIAIQFNFINAENVTVTTTTTTTTEQNLITNQTMMNESDATESPIIKDGADDDDDSSSTDIINQEPSASILCEKRDRPYFLPHKYQISQFYVCVKGQLFLLNCPSGFRFNGEANQCLRKTADDEIEETLKSPALIPHETNCGWYYVVRVNPAGERVLNSCPMPQLFDIPTLECKNYTEVKCRNRFEPKDACDYQIRSSAHAYPCSYLPSCKNRTDGLYPDRLRDCRRYFRCTSERSSESYSCTEDTLPFGERFSFEQQRCIPAQYVECVNDQQKPF